MSFDTEWARIKQEVAAGGPTTRLASAGDEGGSGGGDVVSTPQAWRDASGGVEKVAGNAKKALSTLDLLQGPIRDVKSGGVECLGAQSALYDSWNDYVYRVWFKTAALQGDFARAGSTQWEGDQGTKSVLENLIPDVGGVIADDRQVASAIRGIDGGEGYQDTPELGGGPDLLRT